MIAWVIEEEFGIKYHPGHVRKLPDAWGFSVQRPRRVLARADLAAQDRWHRRIYPALKKIPSAALGANLPGRIAGYPDAGLHGDAVVPATDPILSGFFLLTIMSFYLCASVYPTG